MTFGQPNKKLTDPVDGTVLFCYIALVIIGIMTVFATTYTGELTMNILSFKYVHTKQLLWASVSFLMFFSILGFDRRAIQFFSYPLYVLILILLMSVFVFGERTKGDQNWINLGFFKLQPSEFAKFATAMALANFFDTPNMYFKTKKDYLIAFTIIGLPFLMVGAQGDAGSCLVFLAFVFVLNREGLTDAIIYLGLYVVALSVFALVINVYWIIAFHTIVIGILIYLNWFNKSFVKILALLLVISTAYTFAVSHIFNNVLEKHQKDRINVLLGNIEDKRGIAYNLNQSKIAIGSGGIIGKGYLQGTQTRYNFVPEMSTDFIFCSIGEEWGFLGSLVLIALYVIMLQRLILLAERQRSPYGRVYIYSVVAIIFTHVCINIGMTIGILPVVGIPLPFISYGGSSLISFSFMIATCVKLDSERRMTMR